VATGPPVRLIPAPATLPLAEMVARLNAAAPPALLGYPSKLAELAREKLAGRLTIAVRSVTSISELLTPADRAVIEQGFGVPLINSFVSTEGLAGHSEPGGPVLSFASDLCLAEVVDEGNNPVPAGITAAKVLVTNLHNLTQPLIRYELTDRFTRPAGAPSVGWLRAGIEGRADEVFHYDSRSIHPHVIRSTLSGEGAVREYQVRQTEAGIDVTCVTGSHLDGEALTARLQGALRQAGLTSPQVTLTIAEAVPRDTRTGKVRRFIPLPGQPPGQVLRPAEGPRR
jgi:phenylacetate-CoA ligase